jgi:hypothetical protein
MGCSRGGEVIISKKGESKRGKAPLKKKSSPFPFERGRGIQGDGVSKIISTKGVYIMEDISTWAAPEDFATLFKYFWHRDFPQTPIATGARRIDWTIHIGIIVRSIADLMGVYTRFEYGGRTDAVLRANFKDLVAVEWEWSGVLHRENELDKLRNYKVRGKTDSLRYCVLVTYVHTPYINAVYKYVLQKWENARWPLLLILIDYEDSTKISSRRIFKKVNISLFDGKTQKELDAFPAFPWDIPETHFK